MAKKIKEVEIRIEPIKGKLYLNRDDVIAFLKQAEKKCESLNAKADLKNLIKALEEGTLG